jgi:hypothetical protein
VRTCVFRNLGTDEPLTSMNGMARGSGNLIVIIGTDRIDRTLSRPGQALVQDPVQILVTGLHLKSATVRRICAVSVRP